MNGNDAVREGLGPHPWYGDCDGFGPDGECSECGTAKFTSYEAWRAWMRGEADTDNALEPEAVTAAIQDQLGFFICLAQCLQVPEFVAEYDRLRGSNLLGRGTPLEVAIDRATGRTDGEFDAFAEFVRDAVWERLPADVRAEIANRALLNQHSTPEGR